MPPISLVKEKVMYKCCDFIKTEEQDIVETKVQRKYRQIFEIRNDGHVWNVLDDKFFLEKLGGYRKDRKTGVEGLTLAGLLMFGIGQAIRERLEKKNEKKLPETFGSYALKFLPLHPLSEKNSNRETSDL